ncbi:hypothetical protein [uncultured Microbacterium sp.]|uniref:hypothetical protein n=1 Tax=uncultured Microbacterium sp. TaxID=191216 RepID=UPI0025FAE1B1|nr:hypothetical protein [uncultured Microbacterium sp.]
MPITITATLLNSADPQPVRIALAGTAAGQAFTVRATTADGSSWSVPGGVGVSVGEQVLLTDNRTALNSVITYQAVVDGVAYAAAPVTVASAAVAVVQTIDGLSVVPVDVASVTEPRSPRVRASVFDIAGRRAPAARLDVPGSYQYTWMLETEIAESVQLRRILESGRPIVRRMASGVRDFDPVVMGIVLDWSDELLTDGYDTWRRWTIKVREISDPQPSTPLTAYTWVDFDSAMADRVWSYHSLMASTSGWTATGGTLSQQTSGGYNTPAFLRVTASTASTAASLVQSSTASAAATLGEAVVAGGVYTVTVRLKGTAGRQGQAAIRWSGGTTAVGTPVTLTGSWQLASVTATAPAGTTGLAPGAQMLATGVAVGNVIDVSGPTVSKGATVPVGTFDELFAMWDAFDAADWVQY